MTGSKKAVPKYQKLGANVIFAPIACNPEIYRFSKDPLFYEVSFVGSDIGNRRELIESIEEGGIPVCKFGLSPGSVVSFEKLIKIFSNSRINLNFTASYGDGASRQLKARIFEVPMCGGFLLTEYVEGVEEYFEIDKEIVCFETVDEAIEKITYYLAHANERKTIAQAGFNRAHRDHTWGKRLRVVFEHIERNIISNGSPALSQIELSLPENLQRNRSSYHYNLAKELLQKGRIEICIDELHLSLKCDQKSKKSRMLLVMCKLPKILCLTIFYAYDKLDSGFIKIRNKLSIRSRLNAVRKAVHL